MSHFPRSLEIIYSSTQGKGLKIKVETQVMTVKLIFRFCWKRLKAPAATGCEDHSWVNTRPLETAGVTGSVGGWDCTEHQGQRGEQAGLVRALFLWEHPHPSCFPFVTAQWHGLGRGYGRDRTTGNGFKLKKGGLGWI